VPPSNEVMRLNIFVRRRTKRGPEPEGNGIVLVGSFPRPYGGNSVHVQRLQFALRSHYHVEVVDPYGSPQAGDDGSVRRCGSGPIGLLRTVFALWSSRAALAHFHVSGMDRFLIAAYPLLGSLRPATSKVVTIHSGSFVQNFRAGVGWRRAVLRDVLRRFDRVVVVNQSQRGFLESLGLPSERIAVVPAFLPPTAVETDRAREALGALADCERVVVTSGCGFPHYGFHVIFDALERMRTEARPGLLVCAYDTYDEAYMKNLATRTNARSSIVRDLTPNEFAWILQHADGYVRATDRDGDAVAIREAAHFGLPVVASDCVERPPATVLFKTGDPQSLADALESLSASDDSASAIEDGATNLAALRRIYLEALKGKATSFVTVAASQR
jgi:glycogen(starch) synthase